MPPREGIPNAKKPDDKPLPTGRDDSEEKRAQEARETAENIRKAEEAYRKQNESK